MLVLTFNNISSLPELASLRGCSKLVHLSLVDNPVVRKEVRPLLPISPVVPVPADPTPTLQHYKPYLVHLLPSLRFLDFTRIRDTDRVASRALFGTLAAPTPLAEKISGLARVPTGTAGTFEVPEDVTAINGAGGKELRVKLSATERKKVEEMIRGAKSLKEIARLERELGEGRVPVGLEGDVEMG